MWTFVTIYTELNLEARPTTDTHYRDESTFSAVVYFCAPPDFLSPLFCIRDHKARGAQL